jgi:hypothetical protein
MDFSLPPIQNYVYVLILLKMFYKINGIVQGTLICLYGETSYAFTVRGLVQPCETLMASAICHCRHLVNFHLARNDRLYLVKTMDGFMDHEPVKISFFINDVLLSRF